VREWYPGRLVIVGGNDYRLGLFNGDIGVALPRAADGALEVWFRTADGSLRALPPAVLGACTPAYALTVHKAQGSEFDEVVVVLPERDARVLTRELVYTAVTRARGRVALWASAEILALATARTHARTGVHRGDARPWESGVVGERGNPRPGDRTQHATLVGVGRSLVFGSLRRSAQRSGTSKQLTVRAELVEAPSQESMCREAFEGALRQAQGERTTNSDIP
jgi:hypothetical protein